ncbi:MAG: TonB-dependent receptor [Povalibacter sp.]
MRNHHSQGAWCRAGRLFSIAAAVQSVLFAANASAEAEAATEQDNRTLEEVFVLGQGETRQVQSINAQQIDSLPPGTSPLKAIENLPGVNFQSADPYGAYEWSTRITVRGFNQNRLGFTLDRVPLGDMTYGNHNGLHISRAIPTELVDKIVLSQGTGSIDIASSSNLGGAVEFSSADPQRDFGVTAAQMFGSDSARRTFVKLDTGELGTGTRAYVSAVDASTEKWKGAGDQQSRMYTLKVVQPVGEGTLTAYYDYSDRMETDYQDLSVDIVNRRGSQWDNYYPDWNAAVAAAQACGASGGNDAIVCDDAYWNASGLRKDDLGYLALDLPLNDNLRWNATAYLHKDEGQGLWGTPYTTTPGGAPLSIRTTEYDLDRSGVVTALTWTAGNHEINGGVWYETNDFTQARRFYGEPTVDHPTRSFENFQRNPMLTSWEYDFDTETIALHVQDTWRVSDALRVNAGVRSLKVENEATTVVGDPKNGTIKADDNFLPQLGFTWNVNGQTEVFGSAARNMRAFASSGTSGPFSTTAAGFNAIRDVLKPEKSTNYEAGLRWHGDTIEALAAVYHVDFDNRLLGITQGPGIQGNPSVLANVGSVKTNGVETAIEWRPVQHLTWFSSVAWNESQFQGNYTVTQANGSQRVVPVDGKQVPDAPKFLIKSELGYDNGTLFARADVNYTDERFYTYLNEGGVDAYTLLNVGAGYRFRNLGVVDELILQADITNVTDKEYFSTIDSNGFVERDPNGTTQTLLLGAPRQFFVTAKARF